MSDQEPVHDKTRRAKVLSRIYPEYEAGGFPRDSHFVQYFTRVNALVHSDSTVLDFGAGRGKRAEFSTGWLKQLTTFQGRCSKVVGVDVDPVVMENPFNDENIIIAPDKPLPFADATFDVVFSWAVFEHIDDATQVAGELARIVKPGGWICGWTPNKWGYVGVGARLIPNQFHSRLLRFLGASQRREEDVFPVRYQLNTRSALLRAFPRDSFSHHSYRASGPPAYHGGRLLLARLIRGVNKLTPNPCAPFWHIFIRKLS